MKRIIAALAIGALAGMASAMAYTNRDLHHMHVEVKALRQANDQLENENQFLIAERTDPSRYTLRKIQIDCPQGTDILLQTAIKRQVLQSLSFLIGKSMQILVDHPYMPSAIVDVQTITLDKRRYRLHVTVVIMTNDTLHLNVRGQLQADL
ncbi:hypothetical protein Heshes_12310 [Alicyclobacillus hesperidum]|uniref:Sporulation membrane protein YtrI C-terminal domain-containing protein n=1 Tax=Alicyclobacillus hesperidum TaxID=89784 RepID=A0AA37TZ20_9BACL|nr:hypothetical protein [Alicyclobacillus hesperidum]GLV13547.1 hypothetical protein Heshes_12310 [Alicyclobacillus hesperidum]